MMQPSYDHYVAPPVGATWTISQKNTGSYGKDVQLRVTREEGSWQGRPAIAFANSAGATTMAVPDTGRWLAIVGPGGKPLTSWAPALGWEYPLAVGKSWTTPYRMTVHATNTTIPYDLSCKVEGFEDVTVPAGSFKAYKIRCTTTIGTDETYWTSPELGVFVKASIRRSANSPFGPGTQESELVSQTIRR